jgi:putative ABC transport system substrate-binding protein
MKRRTFIAGLSSAAAWPVTGRAQRRSLPVIGYLISAEESSLSLNAFAQGLSEAGLIVDRDVTIDYRVSEDADKLDGLAAEMVARRVAIIVSVSAVATGRAIKASAGTIPIVFSIGPDPVKIGFVANMSRPGGNVTGVTNLNTEIAPKRLDLLHQVVPTATSVALLDNPSNPGSAAQAIDMQAAAQGLGISLRTVHASREDEFDAVFAGLRSTGTEGLVIGADNFFNRHMERLAALAILLRIPAIFQFREFAAAGGLMSYGPPKYNAELAHQVGIYAGRILRGEQAADMPVQQITRVEFVINMKTAKALGLTIPLPLLALANEVIE